MGGNARVVSVRTLAACFAALLLLALGAGAGTAHGASEVTTAGYDNLRDDWDASEPALAPSAISSASFGQLFATQLDGAVYAQPLLYANTLVATTEKANAYGLDPATGAIRWSRSFGQPFKASTIGCSDLKPYLGSTSTPVIDQQSGTVYLTTRLQLGKGIASSHWYLQALSATTGEERKGFPVEIAGTPYNTPGVPFNEGYAMQRPGLLLMDGVVYLAFASNCDISSLPGHRGGGTTRTAGRSPRCGATSPGWAPTKTPRRGSGRAAAGSCPTSRGASSSPAATASRPSPAPSNAPPATLSESVIGLTVGGGGAARAEPVLRALRRAHARPERRGPRLRRPRRAADRILRRQSASAPRRRGRQGRARVPDRRATTWAATGRDPAKATRCCRRWARSTAYGATPPSTAGRAGGCTCSRAPAAASCARSATA